MSGAILHEYLIESSRKVGKGDGWFRVEDVEDQQSEIIYPRTQAINEGNGPHI